MNLLNEELQEEIFEALNFAINAGYYSEQESEELAVEYLEEIFSDYELTLPSRDDLAQLIGELRTPSAPTSSNNFERLRDVFDQLNRERIIAIDYAGFDISEGHEEVGTVFQFMKANDIPRNGYCFFHQQDIERSMDPAIQTLYLAFHSTDGDEQQALIVGNRVTELLKAAGFTIAWDGTLNQRICIQNFQWDKAFSSEDTGAERGIRIMTQEHLS